MNTARILGPHGWETVIGERTAAWLSGHLRGLPRPSDPAVVDDLERLDLLARHWQQTRPTSGSSGSSLANTPEVTRPLTHDDDILSSGQAAQICGLTSRAVRLACEQGRLDGRRDDAGHWHVRRRDLDEWRRRAA